MTSILKADTIQDTDGNNIINENSNTITIGASGDTTNIVGTLQNNGSAVGGLSMADQWRLTANATGGSSDITSNWERNDSTGFGQLGTGMTESSGIFTFPSTGIYLVSFFLNDTGGSSFLSSYSRIYVTTNNSSYTEVARGMGAGGASETQVIPCEAVVDVTDTSNVKVKFAYYHGDSGSTAKGDSDKNETYVTFLKLGAT